MYPPLSMLNRNTSHQYTIPDTDVTVEKGTEVFLAIGPAQRDPKYYSNPDKFDPERFSEKSRADPQFAKRPFFPFGDGPRNCVGLRMGRLQTKIALAVMLEKYTYELSDEMKKRKLILSPRNFITSPLGGIELKIRKR